LKLFGRPLTCSLTRPDIHDLRFGINDSTAMFVDGDEALLNVVAAAFTDCEKE
jgi:hypothetical protein